MKTPNQKTITIVMGVIIAALLAAVIVLAVKKDREPSGVPEIAATQTPAASKTTTGKKSSNSTAPTTTPEPVFDPASGTSDFDAYAIKVSKDGTTYKADFDLVSWQYNADLVKSFVSNPDEKTRSFELDKSLQLSYTSKWDYPVTLDRREVFFDIVNNQHLAPEGKLFHAVVKGGKIVSLVEIQASK